MTAPTIVHHPDCDGWIMRSAEVVADPTTGLCHAECGFCGWRFPAIGAMGRSGRADAERQGHGHGHTIQCDGRCREWSW